MPAEKDFSENLLRWFQSHGRDLPWRNTSNPYEVLIVEKLLQQTSVRKSLIDIYLLLLQKYPTPLSLSQADVEELRTHIQPLGLHYRSKDLVLMATDIVNRFEGKIPEELKDLLSLYGVGDYSARAVLSFAYDRDVPVVDTNVARILFRVFGIADKFPQNPARSRKLIELGQSLVPLGRSKEFNWGMIDLGALICLPKKPLCAECPISDLCKFYNNSNIEKAKI
jgi:A/G-specific adenine glycosylase